MKMLIENDNRIKNEKAITLISLVVTMVVIIILATISIEAVLGEDGLFKNAREVKERNANETKTREDELNRIIKQYNNEIAKDFN